MINRMKTKDEMHVQGPLTSCFLYSPLLGNDWTGESIGLARLGYLRKVVLCGVIVLIND